MNNKNQQSNSQAVNHNPNTNGAPMNTIMTNTNDTGSTTTTAPSVLTLPPALASCLSLVGQAKATYDTTDPPDLLDAQQKRSMLKLPKKGMAQVTGLSQLWQKYGGTLAGADLSQIASDFAHAQSVREVWRASHELTQSLDNDAFTSESAAWTKATQIYSMLDTMARTNKALATALEPFAQYFAEGAQTRKQDKADKLPTKKERRKQRVATKAIEAAAKLGVNLAPVAAATTDHAATPSTGAASNGTSTVHTA